MSTTKIAVTPPRNDTPRIRRWMEGQARERGYTGLKWVEGDPAALMGRKRTACLLCSGEGCPSCLPSVEPPPVKAPRSRWGKTHGSAQTRNVSAGKHPTGRDLPERGEPGHGQKCGSCQHRTGTAASARCGRFVGFAHARSTLPRVKVSWSACLEWER